MIFGKKKISSENTNHPIEARVANSKIYGKDVTKIYEDGKKKTLAIDHVNFDVLENEFVCIVGPSGCGKSTLLKMIGGLDDISEGSIILDEKELDGPGKDRGMVFQAYSLFPWMTVENNIRFGLRLKKMTKSEQDVIVDKYLKVIGLEQFRNSLPKELSGGMKQRVAIARALANQPEVLLMDEPFGALDPHTKSIMQQLMRKIWQDEHPTIIFVTHDIEEAVFLSTKIFVMSARPGRIMAEVPVYLPYERTLELKDTPEFINIRRKINSMLHPSDENDLGE
ncbi:MAG: ABC transporter ATP-binding protein [Treponema sp.]|nr:ABC transporter ATP-binding protein [Treponema sp.]